MEVKPSDLGDEYRGVEVKESPPKSGKYSIQLEAGQYKIDVKRKGFDTHAQYMNLRQGSNELFIEMQF